MKMATLSPPSSLRSLSSTVPTTSSSPPSLAFCTFPLQTSKPFVALKAHTSKSNRRRVCVTKAVEEETQQVQQQQGEEEATAEQQQEQQPVVVPVSPSDTLTMFFQAEGTMSEAAIPTLTKALEETEGVANLKVQVVEGLASVELKKQTTVQATGVASSLVETIQGSGFKLQTLNLSFDDEDDAAE